MKHKAHPSDHSGAHARGTSYHEKNAHTTANGHKSDEAEDHEMNMQSAPPIPAPDMGKDDAGEPGESDSDMGGPAGGEGPGGM